MARLSSGSMFRLLGFEAATQSRVLETFRKKKARRF